MTWHHSEARASIKIQGPVLGLFHDPRPHLSDALEIGRWAARTSASVALAAPDRDPLTYGQLERLLAVIRRTFRAEGVETGEVVVLVLPDSPELVTAFLAISDMAACALLEPSLNEEQYQRSFQRLLARTLVTADAEGSAVVSAAHACGMQILQMEVDPASPAGVFSVRKIAGAPSFGQRTDAVLIQVSSAAADPKIVSMTCDQVASAGILPRLHSPFLGRALTQLRAGGTAVVADGLQQARAADAGIEHALIEIWEDILGVKGICAGDDFFALGGDSLSAAVMLNRVQQELGGGERLVHHVDFFENPTIAALERILRESRDGSGPPEARVRAEQVGEGSRAASVLTLEGGGSNVPLFCFPAKIDGPPYYLLHLSKSLGSGQPFFAVVPPDPSEDNRLLTIQEVARRSVQALREVAPHGPYVLAGHCYGGVLAYEATAQLVAEGEEVTALVLFDTPAPGYPKVLGNWKRYLHSLGALAHPREVVRHIQWLAGIAVQKYGGRFAGAAAASGSRLETDKAELRRLSMGEYAPQPMPVPLIHFIAADEASTTRVLDDPRLGWSEWAAAGLDVRYLRGDHISMFAREHAPTLAAEMAAALPSPARSLAAAAR